MRGVLQNRTVRCGACGAMECFSPADRRLFPATRIITGLEDGGRGERERDSEGENTGEGTGEGEGEGEEESGALERCNPVCSGCVRFSVGCGIMSVLGPPLDICGEQSTPLLSTLPSALHAVYSLFTSSFSTPLSPLPPPPPSSSSSSSSSSSFSISLTAFI